MKILVLGGTSYFGKILVQSLVDHGHTVVVATRGKNSAEFRGPIERLALDRTDYSSMKLALNGRTWDIVYDQVCFNAEQAEIGIRVFGGSIGRLIFTSSQSVYGYGVDLPESQFDGLAYVPDPNNSNFYQEGKRLAERAYLIQSKFPVTFVRFPIVMGPDDPTGRLRWHVSRAKFEQPIYFPNMGAKLTVVSSKDAARFLMWLASTDVSGPINGCHSTGLPILELMDKVQKATEKEFRLGQKLDETSRSPYGIDMDWCISGHLANRLGFAFERTSNWLSDLIQEEVALVAEHHGNRRRRGF